ncbi:unnamed protein product, partial [Ectocarpus sp. 12 AP-2014]
MNVRHTHMNIAWKQRWADKGGRTKVGGPACFNATQALLCAASDAHILFSLLRQTPPERRQEDVVMPSSLAVSPSNSSAEPRRTHITFILTPGTPRYQQRHHHHTKTTTFCRYGLALMPPWTIEETGPRATLRELPPSTMTKPPSTLNFFLQH